VESELIHTPLFTHNSGRRRKGRGRRLTAVEAWLRRGGSAGGSVGFGGGNGGRCQLLVKEEEKLQRREARGSTTRSLYKVFGRSLMMEMEVFKLVVTMLVAERRSGKREKKKFCW
jgi:hypothetical protein